MNELQSKLNIFNETNLTLPFDTSQLSRLAAQIIKCEQKALQYLEVVYVDEKEILRINNEYLDHDYITDVITFSYGDEDEYVSIEGTLFCCAPRIAEQADELDEPVRDEFLRVFIHGLLHLAGYDDQNKSQQQAMRAKEDHYLDVSRT